jgi:hypothetical protein
MLALASLLSLIGAASWELKALAACPNNSCGLPDNCTISIGSWSYHCANDPNPWKCCQFRERTWTYSGSGCVSAGQQCTEEETSFSGLNPPWHCAVTQPICVIDT